MSRIVKHLINSSISNNKEPRRILYYPIGTETENEIIALPYLYYLTSDSERLRQFPNVYFQPNVISEFLAVEFYCIMFTEPFGQLKHAHQLSSQLHVPLIFLCTHSPKGAKKENIFVLNESLEKYCLSICFSQEIADNWMLSTYKVLDSIKQLSEVLDEWTKLYLRR